LLTTDTSVAGRGGWPSNFYNIFFLRWPNVRKIISNAWKQWTVVFRGFPYQIGLVGQVEIGLAEPFWQTDRVFFLNKHFYGLLYEEIRQSVFVPTPYPFFANSQTVPCQGVFIASPHLCGRVVHPSFGLAV